jgi:hypothetical protein
MVGAFYEALCATCPGLDAEPAKFNLAFMAWDAWCGRRRHRALPGYTTFHFRELGARFGRKGFKTLNERYRLFDVHDDWSPKERRTRGYRLAPTLHEALERRLHDWLSDSSSRRTFLISRDGKRLRTIPPAIASRNSAGKKIKAWRGVPMRNVVPVDIDALQELYRALERIALGAARSEDLTAEKAQRCRTAIVQLLLLARTDVAGRGNVIQCYVECPTGRAFIRGTSLQSVPRAVRHAALSGHYDYDFVSCHFRSLEQIARKLGIECPQQVQEYNRSNRSVTRIRKQIATECDLKPEHVKKALIAVLYGAPASASPRCALAKTLAPSSSASDRVIGSLRAQRLLMSRAFRFLHSAIGQLRDSVVHRWPHVREGMLVNDVGCGIEITASKRRKLAHILQGAETAMLRVVANELGEEIEVLQHDGWTAATRLDVPKLRRLIYEKTGYRMLIKEKLLASPVPRRDGIAEPTHRPTELGTPDPSSQNATPQPHHWNQLLRRPGTTAPAT